MVQTIWVCVKRDHKETAGFSPWFHLQGFHSGYLCLTDHLVRMFNGHQLAVHRSVQLRSGLESARNEGRPGGRLAFKRCEARTKWLVQWCPFVFKNSKRAAFGKIQGIPRGIWQNSRNSMRAAFGKRSFFFFSSLLASWLLGFLASWLFGFLAFRLLGLLASWLFGFLASGLFGFLLVYAAFSGFLALAFRILCIPSSSSAGGVLAFAAFRWFMRQKPALAFRILAFAPFHWFLDLQFLPLNHHFFRHHGGGTGTPPPNPPPTV